MLNRVAAQSITTNIITDQELMQFCACLDPNQLPILRSLALAATQALETYLGDFITQRSIRWVCSRGESEKTDTFFRSWLSARSYISYGYNTIAGQWLQFPTSATSVELCQIGVWGMDSINLTPKQDYACDFSTDPARITFTYNLAVQDYFSNFDSLIIDYTGGIAPQGSEPEAIKLAIKIITKKLFENRDTEQTTIIDNGVSFLVDNYKRIGFGGSR
ncbi:hypothetical protein ATPR_2689 [Acetobacter tropicalis NBRC 101654]|uniref:Uncharacterized protein n=1 Tax=Acetobacter tropicalis NBRC 101654 TaxID=749388 RepID=F7VH40_9PROT|nr:phage gp6-like head-tail connector protein [Acetobacter tropicalis]GAA09685.1 hypothetical protein ATPR_2689 [Acetobacter tropicalis NBRC 101654]